MPRLFSTVSFLLVGLGACAAPKAPRLTGLGDNHFPVTCDGPEVQEFFDQGLRLSYAFNHAEAFRSFEESARLDPECAMAWWGQALALGPNINSAMKPEDEVRAREAVGHAVTRSGACSDKERRLIDALSLRFTPAGGVSREERDAAYAQAMAELFRRFPEDPDIGTLATAAFMETRPWNYWGEDGSPQPGTLDGVAALEGILARYPEHPGAIHYYIHLVEASEDPDRAERHADRLGVLMPAAGHMVHMPSHIYLRVGRYADASNANVAAILADEDYLGQCRVQGLYPAGYYPHNIHFLWYSATMEGRSAVAIDMARKVAEKVSAGCCSFSPLSVEDQRAVPYYALVRFGRWEAMLTEPAPDPAQRFTTAMWHYGRGIALAARSRADEAEAELNALRAIAADQELALTALSLDTGGDVLAIAAQCLAGEIAAKRGQMDDAIAHLREAVRLQDALGYMEPPTWHYPVRQSLGAMLVQAGRLDEAEAVYQEDLAQWRENGWTLLGLWHVLRLKGDAEGAREVEQRFRRAFAEADLELTSSVYR